MNGEFGSYKETQRTRYVRGFADVVQVGDMVLLHGIEDKMELKKPWNLANVSIGVPRIPKWS